jgi:hypothetical protein
MVEEKDNLEKVIEKLKYLNSKLEDVNKKKKEIEDKKFTIWAARIGSSLFTIGALGSLTEDPGAIIVLLIFLPVAIWGFTQKTDYSKEEKLIKKLENKIVEELKKLEEAVNNPENIKIELKEIRNVNINKKQNEKFYFKSYSTLIKAVEKEIDYGGIVGTPVKVFGQTVFIGGGGKEKKKVEELEVVDKGEFYISNQRILFLGEKKKYEIKIKDLINYSFDLQNNTLKITSENLDEVLFFQFNEEFESLKSYLIIHILTKYKSQDNN